MFPNYVMYLGYLITLICIQQHLYFCQIEHKEWENFYCKLNKITSNGINNKYVHDDTSDFYALPGIPP